MYITTKNGWDLWHSSLFINTTFSIHYHLVNDVANLFQTI